MYTNYPNTEQMNPKMAQKAQLGELSFSLLAEVLQVCYVI